MILVTGAAGKAGGAVVRALVEAGADGRAVVRDAARAPLPAGVDAVARYHILEIGEHLAGVREQHLARPRQLDAAAVASQELGADLRLEAADGLAQGRLREREILGRATELSRSATATKQRRSRLSATRRR